LDDYGKVPNETFWEKFPKRPLPVKPETKINVEKLEEKIEENRSKMTIHPSERSC
jgi:hypothetical protein